MDIKRYLHFVDNASLAPRGTPGYDKLGKVRPVLEHMTERFKSVYNPGRDIAVDEAMVKFQGRSTLKQYMPKKPTKRGIKVWVLAESSTGYFSRLEVYTGKKANKKAEKGLGEKVVKSLTQDFHNRWHRCYFDNFFTSKSLLCELLEVGVYSIGTARSNRKLFPEALKKTKLDKRQECTLRQYYRMSSLFLRRGDMLSVQSGHISATAWHDTKEVVCMYSGFSPLDLTTVKRRQKTGAQQDVPCSAAMAAYNQHMGGVHRGDQLWGYYHRHTKSRKFYR